MTKTTQRTDVHRPSELIPGYYRELFSYAHATTVDGWPVPGFNISLLCAQRAGQAFYAASDEHKGEAEPVKDAAGRPYPMADIHKGGACDSCGAHHVYGSVYLHEPTGECVALGWQCADAVAINADLSERLRIESGRKAARSRILNKIRRRVALRDFAAEAAPELRLALRCDHRIIEDVRSRLISNAAKYGAKLSEKQEAMVLKIAREEREKASRPAEVNVPAPIVEGRQTVEGTVVSVKTHDSDFGSSLKMTVKVTTDAGTWLAWGTCPSALGEGLELGNDGLRGCTVRFDAKLKAGREAHFALLSRPTKAAVVRLGDSQRGRLDEIKAELAEDEGDNVASEDWKAGRRTIIETMEGLA